MFAASPLVCKRRSPDRLQGQVTSPRSENGPATIQRSRTWLVMDSGMSWFQSGERFPRNFRSSEQLRTSGGEQSSLVELSNPSVLTPNLASWRIGKKINEEALSAPDHGDAAAAILHRINSGLAAQHGISRSGDIEIVGHRVVHGADRYPNPVRVDDEVIQTIEQLEELAPLHNVGALSVIRACRAALDRAIPQIAVFDTAFHRTIRTAPNSMPSRGSSRNGTKYSDLVSTEFHTIILYSAMPK